MEWRAGKVLRAITALACAFGFSLLLVSALINLPAAIDTRQLVSAFDHDEDHGVAMLLQNLEHRDLDPRGFYQYGYSYISAAYGIVRVFEGLGYERSVYLAAFALRLVSLASGVVIAVLSYKVLRRLGVSASLSLCGALAVAASPSLSHYTTFVHPDLLQAAVMLGGLCLLLGGPSAWRAVAASLFAGLGFGVKYSGVFLLSAVATSLFVSELAEPGMKARRAARGALVVAACGAAFFLGWFGTNPYVLSHWSAFSQALEFERSHVARGHHGAESTNPLEWIGQLGDDYTRFGVAVIVVGLVLVLLWLVLAWRSRGKGTPLLRRVAAFSESPRRRFVISALAFCLVSGAFLAAEVNMRRMRYTFHFLPALLILVAFGLSRGIAFIRVRWAREALVLAIGVAILLMTCETVRANQSFANRFGDARVRVGEWIEAHYPPTASVLADWYVYIPPRFRAQRSVAGVTSRDLRANRPDIVVLSEQMSGRYCWKREGTKMADLDLQCSNLDNIRTYKKVAQELFGPAAEYRVVYEDRSYVVVEHTPKHGEDPTDAPPPPEGDEGP